MVNSAEVLAASREPDPLGVLDLIGVELLSVRVQDVVQADLVGESYSHIVAAWVEGARN